MPNTAAWMNTYGATGLSYEDNKAITRAMLRFDQQGRCYIEFYADDGKLMAITEDRFLNQEDAKLWIAIRFAHLLSHIS